MEEEPIDHSAIRCSFFSSADMPRSYAVPLEIWLANASCERCRLGSLGQAGRKRHALVGLLRLS